MMALELLTRHPLIAPLGWALVHFLWQGLGIALLLAVALRARDGRGAPLLRSADARYLTTCLALVLMAACPVITLSLTLPVAGHAPVAIGPALPGGPIADSPALSRSLPPTSP